MILNRIEKLLVSNPARGFIQRHLETRRLLNMGGPMNGGKALEIGCGPGFGVKIILDSFGADEVDAFDLDPDMVAMAGRRLKRHGRKANFRTGDAANIDAGDNTYDAVFDFFVIHHVPNWRDAVKEVYRVLKPGGRFYAGEILERLITNPIAKRLLEHPQHDRFSHSQFIDTLTETGFTVKANKRLLQWAGWYIADKPC